MGSWATFLFAYLLGGLTFIPLVVVVVLSHAHWTLPSREDTEPASPSADESIVQTDDDTTALEKARAEQSDAEGGGAQDKPRPAQDNESAAGYFAVCREYVPMGINAKPIERATPVGPTTVAAPSQSVYQTMYRSIFDRKPQAGPLENKNPQNQRPRNAGNVFYVVLRHGHLMLFDDEEQLEVRHVVSLAHHDISIYSGGDVTPEGELFIKRNALRLTRRREGSEPGRDTRLSKPFYLFSEDSSAKEDFYFAMIRNQGQYFDFDNTPPKPKQFEVKNIISLVQKLHSTEEHVQTRWLNAMIGRIFLSLYRSADLEHFIREKLTKKISRVKKPSFLADVSIRKIDTGDSAPVLLNPRHKDLNIEGECTMEADVKYNGNFRLEVAATARLDLGTRFKVREVNMVLSVVLKKLEGHVLFKIKPPPSNRVWFSFQTMPKMEMTIEPIVSSRQITYTLILRQIENRIKEVFAETLVQPFWDDIPFFHTEHKQWRGGIWEGDDAVAAPKDYSAQAAQEGDVDTTERLEVDSEGHEELRPMEKSLSAPLADNVPPTGLLGRKLANRMPENGMAGTSTGISPRSSTTSLPPRTLRSHSLSGTSDPVVGTDPAHADVFKPSSSPPDHASHMMAALSVRSSPLHTPADTPSRPASVAQGNVPSSSGEGTDSERDADKTPMAQPRRATASSTESTTQEEGNDSTPSSPSFMGSVRSNTGSLRSNTGSISKGFFLRREETGGSAASTTANGDPSQKRNTLAAIANATTQARQWGWNAIQKRREGFNTSANSEPPLDLNKPIGRGRPLPPPGTPLPRPDKNSKVTAIPVPPKRKPVAPPPLPERHASEDSSRSQPESLPPPLPTRRHRGSKSSEPDNEDHNMLVVEAPLDSEPTTPLDESVRQYTYPSVQTTIEDDFEGANVPNGSPLGRRAQADATLPVDDDLEDNNHPESLSRSAPDSRIEEARPVSPIEARPVSSIRDDDDDFSGWLDDNTDDLDDEAPSLTTELRQEGTGIDRQARTPEA